MTRKTKTPKEQLEELRKAVRNAGYDPDLLVKALRKDIREGTAFWR